ncbi:MAG: serine/threonine-protein kinase [Acidimicrobiales bacterium]
MTTVDLGIDHLSDAAVIGRGGFATVYAATNDLLGTRVAVKVLAPLTDETDRRRFERECRVMGRVSTHPSVVTVHHAGYSAEGRPYLVMELMEGGSLADRLRVGGPLHWTEAVDHGIAVAEALAHAHAEGILHRDVKPENILVAAGRPRLTDFGIAYLRDSTGATSASISASWLHAPPETFANQRDERSDLYSLGSTVYQLVTGHAPFWRPGEDSLNPLLYRLVNEPAPRVAPELAPPALDDFLQRCLAKDPDNRPATAAACVAELRAIRAGAAVPAGPVPDLVATVVAPAVLDSTVVAPAVLDSTVVAPAAPRISTAGSGSGSGTDTDTDSDTDADTHAGSGAGTGAGGVHTAPDHEPGGPEPESTWSRRGLPLAAVGVVVAVAVVAAGLALALRGGGGGDSSFEETDDGTLVYYGHGDGVTGLAQLSDGRLVSASNDSTVQVWDPDRTDVDPIELEGHESSVRAVTVLGDDRIVSASADGTARVWDVSQPDEPLVVFDGHGAEVAAVAALGDGGLVATAGEDGAVQVWDAPTGTVRAVLDVGGAVRAVIAVEGGAALVAGGTGGRLERWDQQDPAPSEATATYPGTQGSINALAPVDADRFVSVGEDGVVRLWSVGDDSGPADSEQHDEPIDAVTVTSEGVIVYADRSGTVMAWNLDTGDVDEVADLGVRVRSLLALPDGRLVAGTAGSEVRLWTPVY